MLALHLLILLSVVFFVACLVVGLGAAGLRGLRLWQSVGRFQRVLDRDLAALSARTALLEREAARTGAATARIEEARARLEASLAYAAALARGAGEAAELVKRVRGLWPRK
jgi:hypothetical protein